jgi:hypothetical protein
MKIILFLFFIFIFNFSYASENYNCNEIELKKLNNLRNKLEKDLNNTKIEISKECRLFTKKTNYFNKSNIKQHVYKEIYELEFN